VHPVVLRGLLRVRERERATGVGYTGHLVEPGARVAPPAAPRWMKSLEPEDACSPPSARGWQAWKAVRAVPA
jgi:hypothetical protein